MLLGVSRINRYFLLILIGFVVYLVVGALLVVVRFASLSSDWGQLFDALATNFLSDISFFALVGAVGVAAQFYGETGDVLHERLRRVFASRSVTLPVLEFFENVVRANSVFAELSEHQITVTEFSPDLRAYRGSFQNTYHLRNAFGDVPYDAEVSVEVAPDFDGATSPLAEIEQLDVQVEGEPLVSHVTTPQAISNKGFKKLIRMTVPAGGQALYTMAWWSWIAARGESGFSQKRFSERFIVKIVNASTDLVRVSVTDGDTVTTISPGDTFVLRDVRNVPPRTRVDFVWAPPDDGGDARPALRASVVLDYEKRLGETRPQDF